MVQVRDLVIGGGNFAVESAMPQAADFEAGLLAENIDMALQGKMERDADAYNIKAETDLQLFGMEALQKARVEAENPDKITEKFFETYKTKYDELLQSAPNQIAKDRLAKSYEGFRGSYGQRAIAMQVEDTQAMRIGGMEESVQKIGGAMVRGELDYKTAKTMAGDIEKNAANILGPTDRYRFKRNAQKELAKAAWESTPDNVKYQVLTNAAPAVKGGFSTAMEMVHYNEGKYTASDGASKAPAMMGINSGVGPVHKKAFDELMKIYETKGEEAAKNYADNFYKEQYWNKYKIGELPEETQVIVMDGVINHWENKEMTGFASQLVNAAKNGATPEQLIEMRKQEYNRLVNSPGKEGNYPWRSSAAGWQTRIDNLQKGVFGKTGTAFDDLDISDKVRAVEGVKKWQIENEKLKIEDYPKWARENGVAFNDMITAQTQERPFAIPSVLGKEMAEAKVTAIKNIEDYKQLFEFANEVPQEYADSYYNDLIKAKAPISMVAAMQAINKSPAYAKHGEYAVLYNRKPPEGQPSNDELLKSYGNPIGDILAKTRTKLTDENIEALLKNEMRDGNAAFENTAAGIAGIAAGYLLANPDANQNDAVEFAMQPLFDGFMLGKVNGYDVRIPKGAEQEIIESKLNEYIRDKAFDIKKDIPDSIIEYSEMYPVYNKKTDSYAIATELSGLVRDNVGNPLIISRRDLSQYEGRISKIQKLPYNEREAARREYFGVVEANKAVRGTGKVKPSRKESMLGISFEPVITREMRKAEEKK